MYKTSGTRLSASPLTLRFGPLPLATPLCLSLLATNLATSLAALHTKLGSILHASPAFSSLAARLGSPLRTRCRGILNCRLHLAHSSHSTVYVQDVVSPLPQDLIHQSSRL